MPSAYVKQGAKVKGHASCSRARTRARHAMAIPDMRTQACVHEVRVRLTDCLLHSRNEFGASTMSRTTGGVPAIMVVRFRLSAVRTVKVSEDGVKVCESQARVKAVERAHYAQDMPAREEIWFCSEGALA